MKIKLKLEIESDNDSLQASPEAKVAKLLNVARGKLLSMDTTHDDYLKGELRDNNGDIVGWFEFSISTAKPHVYEQGKQTKVTPPNVVSKVLPTPKTK